MVEVYAIHLTEEKEFLQIKQSLISKLPDSSREIINKFKRPSDLQRSLLGDLLSRTILSDKLKHPIDQIVIEKSMKGKPRLEKNTGLFFNISHSGNWVVASFSDSEVGIDIERIKPVNYRIAERFFSKEEYLELDIKTGIEKLNYFFDLWTLKESYLKLLGKGLTKALSSFTIIKSGNGFLLQEDKSEIAKAFFKQYNIDTEYKLSVCSFSNDFSDEVKIKVFEDLK